MRNRRREHQALGRIAAIRAAERGALHQELLEADREAGEATGARHRADAELRSAEQVWREHLASDAFLPELSTGLAGMLVASAQSGIEAQRREREAIETRAEREAGWRDGDARCRQAERSLRTSSRGLAREREDRALDALADRVTFAWRQA